VREFFEELAENFDRPVDRNATTELRDICMPDCSRDNFELWTSELIVDDFVVLAAVETERREHGAQFFRELISAD
jgi:hypothetical protein